MINANDIYEDTMMGLNKGLRGWATPSRFIRAWRQAELRAFNHYLGRPEDYQPGRAVPRIGYGMTRKVNTAMSPFLVQGKVLPAGKLPGEFSLPSDCEYLLSLKNKVNSRTIEEVDPDEFDDRATAALLKPTLKHPIACVYSNYINVLPVVDVAPIATYLRLPRKGKWAYTLINGRPVYDPANSVNSEFLESDRNKLVARIIQQLAENQKAQESLQTNMVKSQIGE